MELIETIKYKNCTIEIYPDEGYESPDTWGDDNLFLVGYHRDFTVTRDNVITKDQAANIFNGEENEDTKAITDKYYTFGLEAYIHSGVVLALSHEGNFCDRNWDVSQLGLVLVSKEEFKEADARETALGLIETWNQFLSGDVYGYQTKDKDGDDIDSCWGYYGDKEYMIDEAKSSIDHHLKTIRNNKRENKQALLKLDLGSVRA